MSKCNLKSPSIVLATANARFSHTSLALRSLKANLNIYASRTDILEFTLDDRAADIVERILQRAPNIVGLSVYIWNSDLMVEVAHQIKQLAPPVIVVVGGPEVSYNSPLHPIFDAADHIVQGEGEVSFFELVNAIALNGEPPSKIVVAEPPHLEAVTLPYHLYSDDDVAHRVIYVETSRGCPFRCAFCLSALDSKVRRFSEDAILAALGTLYRRGVRQFKFIDRALHLGITPKLLDYFLDLGDPNLFLHFEINPDRLPKPLLERLAAFPSGAIQVEAGIQTLNTEVAKRIGRNHQLETALNNLRFLATQTGVHIHADLVVGLPGESFESIREGFDRLYDTGVHEIQVGILKRLHGAPIAAFDTPWQMVYNRKPPYDILQNNLIDFSMMQSFKRFAKVFDLVSNRGHFKRFALLLLGNGSRFDRFWHLSDWLYRIVGRTHSIALNRLAVLLFEYGTEVLGLDKTDAANCLYADFKNVGRRSFPGAVDAFVTTRGNAGHSGDRRLPKRQARHLT